MFLNFVTRRVLSETLASVATPTTLALPSLVQVVLSLGTGCDKRVEKGTMLRGATRVVRWSPMMRPLVAVSRPEAVARTASVTRCAQQRSAGVAARGFASRRMDRKKKILQQQQWEEEGRRLGALVRQPRAGAPPPAADAPAEHQSAVTPPPGGLLGGGVKTVRVCPCPQHMRCVVCLALISRTDFTHSRRNCVSGLAGVCVWCRFRHGICARPSASWMRAARRCWMDQAPCPKPLPRWA